MTLARVGAVLAVQGGASAVSGFASCASRRRSRFMPSLLRRRGAALAIGLPVGGQLDVGVAQGRDVLERAQLVRLLDQRAAHGRLLADRRVDRRLERAVAAQQVGRGLLADPLRAGQAVRRVAAQRDEVRHQRRRDAVALARPPRAPISVGPSWRALLEQDVTPPVAHWNMSRSPVRISAVAARRLLALARRRPSGRRPRASCASARSSPAPRRAPARAPTGARARRASAARWAW